MLLGVLLVSSAFAQSLPLEGFYRPGNFIPVKIEQTPQPPTLSSAGGVTTTLADNGGRVYPFLPLSQFVQSVQVGAISLPLRPLQPQERLIGVALVDPRMAQSIFPEHSVIPITLEGSDPLPEPIFAWDSLDAVLLSSDAYKQLDRSKVENLLACGVTLAVRSIRAPDARFPWNQEDDLWTLRPQFKGPAGAEMGERLLQPLAGWSPARSGHARTLIVLGAVIFSVLVLLLSLLPGKWSWAGIIMLSILSATGIAVFAHSEGARSWVLQGDASFASGDISQHDSYLFFVSLDDRAFELPIPQRLTYPLVVSQQHAQDLDLRLDGSSYRFRLAQGRRVGFLVRGTSPNPRFEGADLIELPPIR